METPKTTIRTSQHTVRFANAGKRSELSRVLAECRRVASIMLDDVWTNGYSWEANDGPQEFSVGKNQFRVPPYLDYNRFGIETFLSARLLSSLCTQLAGMISASVEKQRKRLYVLKDKKQNGVPRRQLKTLIRKLKQNIPQKPSVEKMRIEVSSKCADYQESDGEFNAFLRLKSLTTDGGGFIKIPIRHTKHSNRLKAKSIGMKNSYLVGDSAVDLRWEIPVPAERSDGIILGGDQGMKTVLTLSNQEGNTIKTPEQCPHGHTLESICVKLSRKRKGSKAFKRAQAHRKNHINWSINQLNLAGVRQINLEKIWNINFKKNTSKTLSHWTNTAIRDKVEDVALMNGVRLTEQSSTYRSQRCSACGLVRKANRKGKIYKCRNCGFTVDADENASRNHSVELPEIPWTFRKTGRNRGEGFFWTSNGLFDQSGRSLESLPPQTKETPCIKTHGFF